MTRLYKTAFDTETYKKSRSYFTKDELRKKRKQERKNKLTGKRNKKYE